MKSQIHLDALNIVTVKFEHHWNANKFVLVHEVPKSSRQYHFLECLIVRFHTKTLQ